MTYLGMIIDKGEAVLRNNKQTADYMDNIQEYLEQLEKIQIAPAKKEEPKQTTQSFNQSSGDAQKEESGTASQSPLIP